MYYGFVQESLAQTTGEHTVQLIADPGSRDCTDTEKEFVSRYIAYTKNKDAKNYWSIVHPKSKECITKENQFFYKRAEKQAFLQQAPDPYKCTAKPFMTDSMLNAAEEFAPYPVIPSTEINIYSDKKVVVPAGSSKVRFPTKILLAVGDNKGKITLLLGCINDEGMKMFSGMK
jgi:hypothetical protein